MKKKLLSIALGVAMVSAGGSTLNMRSGSGTGRVQGGSSCGICGCGRNNRGHSGGFRRNNRKDLSGI